MKPLLYTAAIALLLTAVALAVVSFPRSKTYATEVGENALIVPDKPNALPATLVGLPDIELVPIYPDATVTFTNTESVNLRHITYQVDQPIDKVAGFYQEMLPKQGWLLRSGRSQRNLYSWADPGGKLLWQMYLSYDIELTPDESKTVVYLRYGRYPFAEGGLPLYGDAQQVEITHSTIESVFADTVTPVRITDVAYLSNSSPQEIATFYTNSMQEQGWSGRGPGWSTEQYGWFPFKDAGSWEGYSPHEGLYFVAWRPAWGEDPTVSTSYHLLGSAQLHEDGRVLIKLHLEEWESSLKF